jgi:hypothetical protein
MALSSSFWDKNFDLRKNELADSLPDDYKTETLVEPTTKPIKKSVKRKSKVIHNNLVEPQDTFPENTFPENTLTVNTLTEDTVSHDSFCLEQATLASLEESWKVQAECNKRWSVFQPILNRLKRLGMLDKNIKKVYDILSVTLYQYAHKVDVSITEEEYMLIDKHMQLFRMTKTDSTHLNEALNHLRFGRESTVGCLSIT